jgi:hypothetical protein
MMTPSHSRQPLNLLIIADNDDAAAHLPPVLAAAGRSGELQRVGGASDPCSTR